MGLAKQRAKKEKPLTKEQQMHKQQVGGMIQADRAQSKGMMDKMGAWKQLQEDKQRMTQVPEQYETNEGKMESLAYVSPEEMAMLKRQGGSGEMTPYGVPSFAVTDDAAKDRDAAARHSAYQADQKDRSAQHASQQDNRDSNAKAQEEARKRAEAEALARQKNDPSRALRNVYLTQAIEDGYDAPEAQRIADYQITTKTELQNKVGRERIGGLIEFDLNDEKQKKKQLPKLKKDIGKYFYDPYDGKIKLLTEQNGVLGFVEFNSVADITFGDLPAGVSTETSTPYADEQAAIEQEKSEGVLTDEDIIAQRFP